MGFSKLDEAEIHLILRDPRGWARDGYDFIQVPNEYQPPPDVFIIARSPKFMNWRFKKPELRGLSVTVRTYDTKLPPVINIHMANWRHPPVNFIGDRSTYRAYLIQHEMGHALGHGHAEVDAGQTGTMRPCPVMYQQSRGTKGICIANPWQ